MPQQSSQKSANAKFLAEITTLNNTRKDVDAIVDDETFRLVRTRINATNKSEEILTKRLDEHYSTLRDYSSKIKVIVSDNVNYVDDLSKGYLNAASQLKTLSESNEKCQAELEELKSSLHERIQSIKKVVEN